MSGAAIQNPSRAARVGRLVGITWIFILVGPFVGTLVFMLLTALLGMGKGADLAGLTWIALFALIYGLPFGYLIGVWPAIATGLAIGIRQIYFGGASLWFAILAAVVICVGFLLLTGQSVLPNTGDEKSFPEYSALMLATSIAATLVCWSIVRTWHVSTQGTQSPA